MVSDKRMLTALILCLSDFANVFSHVDSISIGHQIDLSLLGKTRILKNIQILKQLLWKR